MKSLFTILFIFTTIIKCFAQVDPNNNQNWDWLAEPAWLLYPTELPLGTAIAPNNPFYQEGIGAAVYDNKPEDGWFLVRRDFGTTTRQVDQPFIMLYNKYQGLLRVFIFLKLTEGYTKGAIQLFGDPAYERTVSLTFLDNISWGRNDLIKVIDRHSSATTPVNNNRWAFADFPITYDPTVSNKINARLQFKVWGLNNYTISLNGLGTINQVFGEEQPANISNTGLFSPGGEFNALGNHMSGAQDSWLKWQNTIKNMGSKIDSNTTSKSLKNLRDWVKNVTSSWTVGNLGLIGAGVGLVDFLITGGRITNKEQPAPMNFAMNFTVTGHMDIQDDIGAITLPLPGANHTVSYSTNLLYNLPLGTLNLQQTPVLQHRNYWWPRGGGISTLTHSYRMKDDFIFELNPHSDLEISNIEAAFVFELTGENTGWPENFLSYADQGYSPIDGRPIELESYNNEKYVFRTPYVNAYAFKNQSITLPAGFNLYVKVKALLKVKNSPADRQPVIFVATYDANVEESSGSQHWPFTVSTVNPKGLQFVSVPLTISNYSRYSVFPTIPSQSNIYSYVSGSGYTPVTTLTNGPGYWADFPAQTVTTFTGSTIPNLSIPVSTGWNIIGSISYNVPKFSICSNPQNIITGYIFSFIPGVGYQSLGNNDNLLPGGGYWVETTTSGNILLEVGADPCEGLAKIGEEEEVDLSLMDKFIISDASGNSQTLYVKKQENNVSSDIYLPPAMPEMMFDSRFENEEFIKSVNIDEGPVDLNILVQSNSFPISLTWELNPTNEINYSFISDSGLGKVANLKSTYGSHQFFSLNNNKINLFASSSENIESILNPSEYSLIQNYPNPFNPSTKIQFSLKSEGLTTLKIYNVIGEEIKTLVNEYKDAGTYQVVFNASNLPSGVYIYKIQSGDFVSSKKMILIK
jgi:hypothetical protein